MTAMMLSMICVVSGKILLLDVIFFGIERRLLSTCERFFLPKVTKFWLSDESYNHRKLKPTKLTPKRYNTISKIKSSFNVKDRAQQCSKLLI